MTDKELFGNSEQLDDTISRREALDALTKQADEMSRWCERYQEQRKGVLTARNIIKDLPSAQQWIPVTERLPKSKPEDLEYPVVAVCLDDGSVITACYYESTETWGCGEYYDRFCYPVAWMPLPEKWEGGQE